jgi:hypothetical protein
MRSAGPIDLIQWQWARNRDYAMSVDDMVLAPAGIDGDQIDVTEC